jgi:hypothetical protein
MISKIKHIGLASGLFSTIISFIFFGRQQETYQLLLIGGVFVSLVFFLTILFSKGTIKSKVVLIIVVLFAILIQWLTEPLLIKTSFSIFLNKNIKELTIVNNILSKKTGEISIYNDKISDKLGTLTQSEKENLIKLRKKLNVYIIVKTDNEIYFGLWGFLDVRLGIIHLTKNEKPNISYQHLKDNWYY